MSGPYELYPACSHAAPDECRRCNGDGRDEAEQRRQSAADMKRREHLMRTDARFRAEWVASFPESWRDGMAAMADAKYGRLGVAS